MNLILVIIIPLLVTAVSFVVFKGITWKEAAVQLVSCIVVLTISWQIAKWAGLSSTQLLNGRITEKVHGTQKCCHCHDVCTGRDKDGKCTSSVEVCAHSRDNYWDLHSTVGTFGIDSCEPDDDPPVAWKNAYVGEPAAIETSYTNYLKADPESLFARNTSSSLEAFVPGYPSTYDHYKVDHVVSDGVPVPKGLQEALREANADLGSHKQVDVTLLLTTRTPNFAQSVEKVWLYGPKNSVNIVAGVKAGTIEWVRVVTFSKVESLKVKLRDSLQGMKLDDPSLSAVIKKHVVNEFQRTPMAEYEYLARAAEPKGGALIAIVVIQLILSVGLAALMHTKDLFGEDRDLYRFPHRRRWV